MKVLIVGSGGREHAIAASVAKSNQVEKIYCAPGNAGIGQIAECVDITAMEFDKLADFAEKNQIDLTIIGMENMCTVFMYMNFFYIFCVNISCDIGTFIYYQY